MSYSTAQTQVDAGELKTRYSLVRGHSLRENCFRILSKAKSLARGTLDTSR